MTEDQESVEETNKEDETNENQDEADLEKVNLNIKKWSFYCF